MNSVPPGLSRSILRLAAAHPLACAIFLAVVSVVSALGLPRLNIEAGTDVLLLKDSSARQAYVEVTRQFGSDSRIFLYLRDEKLWSPSKLAALERLHEDLQRLPFVERVDDLFTATTIRSVDRELTAQPLLAHAPADDHGAEMARIAALADPIAVRNLISADGKSLAIGVTIREAAQGKNEQGIQDALDQVVARVQDELPSLTQTGPLRLQGKIASGIQQELTILGSLSALFLALIVWGLCRNAYYPILALAGGALSLLWTFGLMGFQGLPVTVLSVMLPPLVLALASIDIVSLACTPADAGSHSPDSPRQFIDYFARHFGASSAVAILALMIGLVGQALSGIEAVSGFGLAMAFAITAGRLATVMLQPILARCLLPRPTRPQRGAVSGKLMRWATYFLGKAGRRQIVGGTALAALAVIALMAMIPGWPVAHDPQTFFGRDNALIRAADSMDKEIAGTNLLYITLDSNAEGAFRDPANLRRLADIQSFIAKQEIFDRSLSLADIVSQANQEATGGRSEAYEVPPTRKLVGQYLALRSPRDLEPYVSHDFRRANIVIRHNVRDSATLSRYLSEMHSAITHFAGPSMTATVVGSGVLVNAAVEHLLKAEAIAVVLVLAFVLVATALMYTSAQGGLIAMALTAAPNLIILGAMRVLEIPISMTTVLVAFVSIAITMQGTGRLFSRYSEHCRDVSSYREAATIALNRELAPLTGVVATVMAVFSILLLSGFKPLVHFGGLACAAALLAWFTNILIAPLLLPRIRLVGLSEMLAVTAQREALEGSPLFSGLSSYQIRKTILISELREYGDGERLIEQDTLGRSMHVIVSGYVEIIRRSDEEDQLLAVLGPGEVFGEIGFVHETYRTADVRALGPVAALRFDHDRLKKDLVLFPHIMSKLNFNISGILGKRLSELVAADQSPKTLPQRDIA